MKGLLINQLSKVTGIIISLCFLVFFYVMIFLNIKTITITNLHFMQIGFSLLGLIIVSTAALDDKKQNTYKFNIYILSTPISNSTLLLSKYVFQLCVISIATVITLIFNFIVLAVANVTDVAFVFNLTAFVLAFCLLIMSLEIPINYFFGPKSTSLIELSIFIILAVVIMLILMFGDLSKLYNLIEKVFLGRNSFAIISWILLPISIIVCVVSYRLAIKKRIVL